MNYYDVLLAKKLNGGGGGGGSSNYQLCEYIQNTGNSYIDTGLTPSQFDKVVVKASLDSLVIWTGFFGTQSSTISLADCKSFGIANTTSTFSFKWGTTDSRAGFSWQTNTLYEVEFFCSDTSRSLEINGSYLANPQAVSLDFTSSNYPCYLFCTNYGGTTKSAEYLQGKIYGCDFYLYGTKTAEFLPAYDKTTNEVGMLETISNTFYHNAGTGVFSKGQDISDAMILNILLGEAE